MKVIKKICVYLLVGLLTFSSAFISYEKANSCKAVSFVLEIGTIILGVGMLCYGAYYVSDEENREKLKETMTDYKNMTTEAAQSTYEMNKKIFNDFIDYATSNGGGSAAVYSADGRSYTVNEMAAAGFPEFDDWDKEMKKQGDSSGGGFGSIWDKLSFGLDLLDFVADFFEDNKQQSDGNYEKPFTIYTGDSGYINRSTGSFNGFVETDSCNSAGMSPALWEVSRNLPDNDYISKFRVAVLVESPTYAKYYDGYGGNTFRICCTVFDSKGNADVGIIGISSTFGPWIPCNAYEGSYTFWGTDYTDITYISTNLPVFIDGGELRDYLLGLTDGSNCVNVSFSTKNVIQYCNYFNGKNVSPADIVNVNYNISNNWDGTTENLTVILNGSNDNVTPAVTPTASPVPTLPDQDGSNTTNNYIINITNILQPIQETVTNIYNFFIIDTEEISLEINNINTTPVSKFNNFVITFGNLKNTFSNDTQEVLAAAGSTQRGISYPVLKVESPKILKDYVPDSVRLEQDGKTYIVLCDCSKYAVQFSMVRTLLKVILWFGFIFYLLKELKVVISLST